MRIKKIIGVIFVVLIMLILVACGGKTDDETGNKDKGDNINKATPSLDIVNIVETQDSVSFELEIVDVDKVGEIKSIKLYQEDELVKSLEYLNLREFNNLLSNNVYEIIVTYEYDLNDGAGEQEVIAKKAVTTLEKATPSLDIGNVVETQDSVSFELEIVDVDKVGEIKSIKLYQEDELVKSLEDLNLREFNELSSNNVYEIRVTYEYDLNDGLGLKNKVYIKETLTYAVPIEITDLEILNSVNPKVGEEVYVIINYDNPFNLNITSFYVNDQKVNVVTNTSSNNSILKFIPEFEGGIYSVSITGIDYESYGHIKSLEISSTYEDDILVMGSLGIESIQEENGNDYIYSGKENYIIVNLNNPTGYDIEKVSLNIGDYEHEEIDVINENQIRLKLKGYINHYNLISVTSITYGMEDYEYTTKTISGVEVVLYGVNSDEVRYISTIEELQNLEDGYVYELTNDIDASGFKWIPYEFRGVIYGNGFKITNLSIVIENESTDEQYYGLFSKLSNGLISSLGLRNSYISIKTKGVLSVGGLVGELYSSTVTNSYVENTTLTVTTDSSASVGGLVGYSSSEITNSYVENTTLVVDSKSYAYVGGLVGNSSSSEITNSYVENTTLTVTTDSYAIVGGLVGSSSEITNSYVDNTTLTVTTDSSAYVGGLVGSSSEITNSYVDNTTLTVTTDSSANVGGLVGISSSEITNSYVENTTLTVTTDSDARAYVGGLVGRSSSKITNSYVENTTLVVESKGNLFVGGLVGVSDSIEITNSYVEDTTLTVTTDSYAIVGGLVGSSYYEITNSYVENTTLTVTTTDSSASVGGLVGSSSSEITNSYVENTILTVTTDSDYAHVGGLVGESSSSEITNSYVENTTLTVTTTDSSAYVGGLAGSFYYSEITNSYVEDTTLTVTTGSNAEVGGLVGYSYYSEITNSYVEDTTLTVTTDSNTYVGGLVGYSSSSEITNSYVSFDTTIEINNEIVEITDQIIYLEDLNSKKFYIDVLKWDENIWNLDDLDYENNLRPKLKK